MATTIDPAGSEPKALFDAAAFAGARVLEIGAGNGRLACRYASVAGAVVGLESSADDVAAAVAADSPSPGFGESAEALAEAEAERRRASHRLRFVRGSGVQLPFRAAVFDIALFGWSL